MNSDNRVKLKTAQETADILQISRVTLWRLTKRKTIPAIKAGGSVRYDIDKVMETLERNSK